MTRNDYIFHLIAYYLAWFSAILLASKQQNSYAVLAVMLAVLFQVIWQYKVAKRTQGLWLMMALFVTLGTLTDTLMMKMGLIEFSVNPFNDYLSPPWMSALWASFAITFYSVMSFFFERYLLDGILSLVAFPISYSAGAALQAAYLPHGYSSSIVIGLIWALLFPLLLKIYHKLRY
jgi:hypothetical protein